MINTDTAYITANVRM